MLCGREDSTSPSFSLIDTQHLKMGECQLFNHNNLAYKENGSPRFSSVFCKIEQDLVDTRNHLMQIIQNSNICIEKNFKSMKVLINCPQIYHEIRSFMNLSTGKILIILFIKTIEEFIPEILSSIHNF